MGFVKRLKPLVTALYVGEQLDNRVFWKKGGVAIGAISALIAITLPYVPGLGQVDVQTIDEISRGLYALGTVYQLYVHAATTRTIGLPGSADIDEP